MKIPLKLLLSFLIIALFINDQAISQRAGQRPRLLKLKNSSGVEFAKEACKLAEVSLNNKLYDKAINLSQKAYLEAENDNSREWMGVALQIETGARFLRIAGTNIPANVKQELEQAFKRSTEFLNGTASANRIHYNDKALIHLKNGTVPELPNSRPGGKPPILGLAGKGIDSLKPEDLKNLNPKARKALNNIIMQRATTRKAQAQVEDLKEKLAQTKDMSEAELKNMEGELAEQNQLVEGLTAEQARAELLLSKQRQILDSMIYTSALDSIKLANQQNTLSKQQTELALQHSQRNLAFAGFGIVGLLGLGLWFRFKSEKKYSNTLKEKNKIIEVEKAKSDKLLLNILPASVADDLKEHGVAKTRNYEKVTILFTDFVNFTSISSQLSPEELVQNLDYCFKHFDAIVRKYGIEKIKTIGDSYMAAGGLPEEDNKHPFKMIQAAREMQEFLNEWKKEKIKQGKPWFEARIGLHTGPVTAGIVGMDKFAYDIWGDTVNVASRMESSSEPGKINISESLYQLVKEDVECVFRGKLPAKNKGEIEMYFVV